MRARGYRAALDASGRAPRRGWCEEGEPTHDSGYEMARAVLGRAGRPDALVCANDLIALGALDAAWDLGLAVPGDVAIVGFDDVPLAAARPVQLTTVAVPHAEMGGVAVRLLLERLAHPEAAPTRVVLPYRVMVRRTCGAAG